LLQERFHGSLQEDSVMFHLGRGLKCMAIFAATLPTAAFAAGDSKYEPLAIAGDDLPKPIELVVEDSSREHRKIPLYIYLPATKSPAPVILFSHGLGGTNRGSAFIGKHWAARGYVAVFVQHPGSDDSVWRDKPFAQRLEAMRKAAGLDNFMLRVKDIPVVLDQLDKWNQNTNHALVGRLDMKKVGMSGHSFGAVTTQAVSGQTFPLGGASLTDKRIKAAIAFSPSSPRKGIEPTHAFASVKIPWMLMTGTKDVAPIGDQSVESRLAVFPALPPGGKYELVLDKAEHSVFTERPLPGEKEKRNPNHHRAILGLSTAFWDTYLRDDAQAKAWLDGDGPKSILEQNDKFQKK
jgi:predicted dienelactone hydrolase